MLTNFNDILGQFQALASLDKSTWFTLGYACYLYILMDGATRTSARRHSYRRCR